VEALSAERSLLQALQHDPDVHALAVARLAEQDTAELRSLFDGDRTKYETTCKRFRRKLEALSLLGGSHAKHPQREADTNSG